MTNLGGRITNQFRHYFLWESKKDWCFPYEDYKIKILNTDDTQKTLKDNIYIGNSPNLSKEE